MKAERLIFSCNATTYEFIETPEEEKVHGSHTICKTLLLLVRRLHWWPCCLCCIVDGGSCYRPPVHLTQTLFTDPDGIAGVFLTDTFNNLIFFPAFHSKKCKYNMKWLSSRSTNVQRTLSERSSIKGVYLYGIFTFRKMNHLSRDSVFPAG